MRLPIILLASVLFCTGLHAQQSYADWKKQKTQEYDQWSRAQNWEHNYFKWQEEADKAHADWMEANGWEEDDVPFFESKEAGQNTETASSLFPPPKSDDLPTAALNTFKMWAVVVGVAQYSSDSDNVKQLNYCDDDAYKIYAFLKSPEGGALTDEQIVLLIDEEAQAENIRRAIKDLSAKAGKDDVFMFYFSGHGSHNALLAEDYLTGLSPGIVTHEFINQHIKKSKAKLALCVIDACHSGSMAVSEAGDVPQDEAYAPVEKSKKGTTSIAELENTTAFYQALKNTKKGSVFILSSKTEEKSVEYGEKRQGIFSYYFIKGLKGEADRNRDRIISITESFDYTKKKVKEYSKNKQNPVITGDFSHILPLAMLRRE